MKRAWRSCSFTWQISPRQLSWLGSRAPESIAPGEWWASCLFVSCLSPHFLSLAQDLKKTKSEKDVASRHCWCSMLALLCAGADPAGVVKGRSKPKAQLGWVKQWQQILLSWGRKEEATLTWESQRLVIPLLVCEYWPLPVFAYKLCPSPPNPWCVRRQPIT